jgi:DNA-binding transcriptional regulator YhcF (GntR family)
VPERASERLNRWLEEKLPQMRPGERLPTSGEFARQFGVSQLTVKRVLKAFAEKGLVVGIAGKGTFVAPMPAESVGETIDTPRTSAENLCRHLEDLISRGALRRGDALPPIKSVTLQFKVTPATVIAAYKMLQANGRVTKVGKSFWVGTFEQILFPSPKKEVYLFYDDTVDLGDAFENGFLAMSYQKMQNELLFHGYVLRYDTLSNMEARFRRWLRRGAFPYGIVLYDIDTEKYASVGPAFSAFLDKAKKASASPPSALIDWTAGHTAKTPRGVHSFQRGHVSTSAAKALARHLTDRRAARIVFFAGEFDNVWRSYWGWILVKVRTELKEIDERVETRFVVRPEKSQGSSRPTQPHILQVSELADGTGKWLHKYSKQSPEVIRSEMSAANRFEDAFPLHRDAHAWVFSTDRDAVEACEWAREHGIDVPKTLSIIGLENSPRYYRHGLTTCAPDWETNGYLMAHCIIGDIPIAKTTKGFVATRARVLEQLTSR